MVGLNFGFLIGSVAGVISFIPYVGSIVGFLLSVGVALVQFWPDWIWIGVVVGIFAVGQFLEGNILQPRLVGSSIGVHPVWLMFALFAFGSLFGFVGVLLAVPVTAAIGVLVRFAVERYRLSALYLERGDTPPRTPSREPCPLRRNCRSRCRMRRAWGARISCPAPSNSAALRLIEAGPTGRRRWCSSPARGLREDASRAYLGGARRRCDRARRRALCGGDACRSRQGARLAVEDVAPEAVPEAALFHLINVVREQGGSLLMTAQEPGGGLAASSCRTSARGFGWRRRSRSVRRRTSFCARCWSSSSPTASSSWTSRSSTIWSPAWSAR